ncbi:topoisomerase II-associated protein PAT1 [Lasiosphaeria hispida]|uniref:Topoisomerase II-associated protein PAT1 n=1 Tax=Lasiosphaeria hispida TaxID=260671 RepID=A0AAJ0MD94_9PEZI|nr:topoisomerase II-associated protein PAT1 [Lasiosphaeria hispida]
MSFFGFDNPRHNTAATGFSQAHDPFAALSNREDDAAALDFEDTYDGLGDQLDETDDVFNDDTFGDVGTSTTLVPAVGKDFDFFGQTAKVANAIEEEHVRFTRQQPLARSTQSTAQSVAHTAAQAATRAPAPATSSYNYAPQPTTYKPARSGYEKYSQEPVGELQVDAALWGVAPKKQPAPPAQTQTPASVAAPAGRKIMSLEEVEAQMRAQAKKPVQPAAPSPVPQHQEQPPTQYDQGYKFAPPVQSIQHQIPAQPEHSRHKEHSHQESGHHQPVTILQRPQSKHAYSPQPVQPSVSPAVHQRPQQHQQPQQSTPVQPTQILQNPNRLSGDAARLGAHAHPVPTASHAVHPTHRPQGSFSRQQHIITHSSQLSQLSEEEKTAYLDQEAKRAKRNHKIFLMSRDNGIMTPQDKNFVTRIQLQQLVAATGNPNDHGTDESLAEDFYYQVHNQIQGGQRQHPSQPLNNFAQTYLFQTGSRAGGMRRHNRGPENHMQRMEQQVQRAVEAAKNKPKNKQLVIEGSLGKISFSNAKTPKPLLNIKRNDNAGELNRPSSAHRNLHTSSGTDKKAELRSIEEIYTTLMKMEDHERAIPPPPASEGDNAAVEKVAAWSATAQALNKKLWASLRIHDHPDNGTIHPFIALLSYSKGKKAMERIFRHTSPEQRTTILTLIVVNLDNLDVVRNAQVTTGEIQLNAAMRENVELFSVAVMSTLFNFMNELDLDLVAGVLGLVCTRNVDIIAKSKIGVSMLTMILSRAEIIKHSGGGNEAAWRSWEMTYNQFFNLLEPSLPHVFPGSVSSGNDTYVWQLLAAIGIGASPDQQQRLVLSVKDRVMDTVALSKTLPHDLSAQRLQNVNLFMHSIGLDVELLQ